MIPKRQAHQLSTSGIEQEGILAMLAYLDRFWDEALNNFKRLAEETEKNK